jgi:aminotransferase EvaB
MSPAEVSAPAPTVVPFNDLSRGLGPQRAALDGAITRVLDSGWFVLGPETDAFETEFATYCGARGAVGVGSGTDALELALRAVGCAGGGEVIMAANAGGYSALACLAAGGRPVFADVSDATASLDPAAGAAAVTPRTVAVVVTHLYGIAADVPALRAALPTGLPIIEDGSQAHGARYGDVRVGALGDLAAFSFYPTKNLAALGDGGAVTGTDAALLAEVRSLRQYGWSVRYDATVVGGRNSRLDELQAAVLRSRLGGLDALNDRRFAIAERLRSAAGEQVRFVHAGAAAVPGRYVGHLCVIRHTDRDRLAVDLSARGISTTVHFPRPDPDQSAIAAQPHRVTSSTVTNRMCAEVLSIPCFPELTETEISHVIDGLLAAG